MKGVIANLSGKQTTGAWKGTVHENTVNHHLSLFFFFLCFSHRSVTPPHTTHHLFLGTSMSCYIWHSSEALHMVGGSGC